MADDYTIHDDHSPTIYSVDRAVAMVGVKVEMIAQKLDTTLALFATKEELRASHALLDERIVGLNERLKKVEGQISWGVKLVMGAVFTSVLISAGIIARHML